MKHNILIFLMALFFSGNIFAQQEKLSLALADAQSYALEHNRQLKNASIDIQKAEASRWQTIASMLPQINASIDYANMMGYKMTLSGFDISMPPNGTLNITTSITLSASQVIGLQMENIAIKMSDIALKQTEQQVINQVKSIYYSTLVMEETVELLEKNLKNLEKLLDHTEQMVNVGISEQTDADQIAVQVVSMETNISTTKRSLEMLYNTLRLQLGLHVDSEIQLTQSIDELMNIQKAISLLNEEFILGHNFDYQLLQQNIALSEKQVDIKKWAYAPSLNLFYQHTSKKYFSDEETFDMTPPNMIGLSLNVPIFSSGSRYEAFKEAKLDHKKQLNVLDDTEEALIIKHRQLCYNLSSAFERYETQKKNIEVTQRIVDNISRKYEQGLASSLDVTNSGTTLITAQSSYVQVLMELVTAQIDLEELLNINNK